MPEVINVKAGDEVILHPAFGDPRIVTVKRVTPSGLIVIERGINGELVFNQNGRERGIVGYRVSHIEAVTPESRTAFEQRIAEIKARVERSRMINTCRETHFSRLTDDQLRRIVAILAEASNG